MARTSAPRFCDGAPATAGAGPVFRPIALRQRTGYRALVATFDARRFLPGLGLGLGGHALAFLTGFIAARLVEPSEGGGFEDIAAVAVSFLAVEALVAMVALAAGITFAVKGRRELGLGILLGWGAGVILIIAFVLG